MRIERFEDIIAWQHARTLVTDVYGFMNKGEARRNFVVRDQIGRAAVSVMTNIAEGFSRQSRLEFRRFLDIARASAREVQSLLYVVRDLGYIDQEQFSTIYDRAGLTCTIIGKLMKSLRIGDN
jgi:four helix bundle protein